MTARLEGITYPESYFNSPEVWRDIRKDCNILLDTVEPSIDWHKRSVVLLGYALILPLFSDIFLKLNQRLTAWDDTWQRKLKYNEMMIRSVSSAPPSESKRVEIRPQEWNPNESFIILRDSIPFLVRPLYIPRGDGLALESAGSVTPSIAKKYRSIVDNIKAQHRMDTYPTAATGQFRLL